MTATEAVETQADLMQALRRMRVGYVPYNSSLTAPGDRRRFVYWARDRGVDFEIATPDQDYDLVVLTEPADVTAWSRYRRRGGAKLVFDFIDSYLAEPLWQGRGALRGLSKFVTRQARHLELDYRDAFRAMCRRSAAVICTTDEQEASIRPLCSNVHQILDVHTGTTRDRKTQYAAGEVFNLVWEGLPGNLRMFEELKLILQQVDKQHPLALHLVTDLDYYRFLRKHGRVWTPQLFRGIVPRTYFYEWNEQTAARIMTGCDLAIVPVNVANALARGKPENKLLLLWRLGMPVLTTATPAYVRANRAAGTPEMACSSLERWQDMLVRCIRSESTRREAARAGQTHAQTNFSEKAILSAWDRVFESII